MKKTLKIQYPIITTYTHHAHLLSILGTDERTKEWIISNYIQLYANKDLINTNWGDFYFPMPYETRTFETCKWIITQKNTEKFIDRHYEDIVLYIKEAIDADYYVNMGINYKYISNSIYYHTDKVHDVLVYGYDDDRSVILCADFVFSSSKYMFSECSYEEFEKAYNNDYRRDKASYFNHMIYAYQLKKECDYEYDLRNIIYNLKEYCKGSMPEYWKAYNMKNSEKVTWGINYYDALVDYVEKIDYLEIRFLWLLRDHKRIMLERLYFLQKQNVCSGNYIIQCQQLFEDLSIVINMAMKYNITHNRTLISSICKRLREGKQREGELMEEVIMQLELIT